MQLFVKDLSGKSIIIDINETDTVLYLKHQIQFKTHIFHSCQRVVYGSKQLEDDKKLIDYNIKNHEKVDLLLRLRSNNINDHIIFANFNYFNPIEPTHIFVFRFKDVDKVDLSRAVSVIVNNKIIELEIKNEIIEVNTCKVYCIKCKPLKPLPAGAQGIIIIDGCAFFNEYGDFGDKYKSSFIIN